MDFIEPRQNEFTIYSKSGCPNCIKVKNHLANIQLNFSVVSCDDYILEDKAAFLYFIKELSGVDCKVFPMVFSGSKFIGGYKETVDYLDKIFDFENMDNSF
jgi:glutaredoxin